MLGFVFEPAPWEQALEELTPGAALSAARFLTLMEGEEEDALEQALDLLEEKQIWLDVRDLPRYPGGEAAVRLRREEELVKEHRLLECLEENDPLRLYLEELAQIPAFGDLEALAHRLRQGDRRVVEQIASLMLSQVLHEAYGLVGRGVLLQDLIQEGSLGLWRGILAYREGDLQAHCLRYIRSAMAVAVTMQARSCGVGQRLRQALEDYRAVDERLLSELGRNPTLEEIAQELHMTREATAAVADMLESARDLAQAKRPQEQEERPEEEDQAVEDTAYFQARQRIGELMTGLDEQDRQVLSLRFGLEGGKPLSSEETGRRLGLTPEEVVAREAAALAKMRKNG